jgi:predicted nucleic acid-binding protein
MRFWDSSAVVPLLVSQDPSPAARGLYDLEPHLVVWWATEVECVSAIMRLEREGRITGRDVVVAIDRLAVVAEAWEEVRPTERVRATASRLLRTHSLRAADAFQLAAAIVAAADHPSGLSFVTLDERLARAAEREGFPVIEPA